MYWNFHGNGVNLAIHKIQQNMQVSSTE